MNTADTTTTRVKSATGDRLFGIFVAIVMVLVTVCILYPLYFIIIASFSDPMLVQTGKVLLWPAGLNAEGYKAVFENQSIWLSYRNTIFYTAVGTFLDVAVTLTCAFALTKRNLPGKKFIVVLIIFTMLFDGGMIPRFLIVRDLGIYDTAWAMLLPRAASVFCILIARTFIQETIPYELFECAQSEGCSFARYFVSIVVPLSPALIAILILNYGTALWNSFFDAMIYLVNDRLFPLQLVLRDILIAAQNNLQASDAQSLQELITRAETLKYAIIIVASLPMLVLYPFLQKYFVKGVMIGAVKG